MAEGEATYKIRVDSRGAQQSLDGLVKGALPKFEKLSGSINASASALGGLGGKAGQALGAMKQLGEAFLVGGVVGVGLAALATGIGIVVSKHQEAERAAESLAKTMREIEVKAAEETRKSYEDLGAELARLTGRSAEYRVEVAKVEKQRADVAAAEAKRLSEIAAREVMGSTRGIFGIGDTRTEAEAKLAKASMDATVATAAQVKATNELRAAEAALFVGRERGEKVKGKSRDPDATRQEGIDIVRGAGLADEVRAERKAIQEGIDYRAKREAEMLALIAKNEQDWRDEDIALEKAKVDAIIDYRLEQEKIAAEETLRMQQQQAEYVMAAYGMATSVAMQLATDLATQQEHAFERAAASALTQIGTVLVAEGTKAVYQGTIGIMASKGLDPWSYALVAAGVAATGAGIGMGATGAAITASLSSAPGAAGGGGRGTAAERVSSRGDRGDRIGGDGNVTLVFQGGTFWGDPSTRARNMERDRQRAARDNFISRSAA